MYTMYTTVLLYLVYCMFRWNDDSKQILYSNVEKFVFNSIIPNDD